jgi:hypothetical protein
MKFCDKIILIAVCIIILVVLYYVLPIINKLFDGKEGMTSAARGKSTGGVLTDKKRTKVVKPTETITNNGDINETDSGLPEVSNTGNNGDINETDSGLPEVSNTGNNGDINETDSGLPEVSNTGGSSYHVHYHINSNDQTNMTNANLTHMPTGDASQDINQAISQFSSLNDADQEPQTSEFTSKYPCRSSITGMFTDCGPQPGNMECYSQLYGDRVNSE